MEGGKTPSRSPLLLQHPPEAFNRIVVVAAPSGQALPPKARMPMGQRRRALVRPVEATAIDDQPHRFSRGATRGHPWMAIVPKPLGITLRDDFLEDF
jgi:hypothetical protein